MLYFLGNCQMDFLSRAMADRGHPAVHRVLASPLTYTSSPGRIPPELEQLVNDMGLHDYFHDRSLENQYRMIGPNDVPPTVIVMGLFHENTPLLIHNEERYIFFMDPAAWNDNPDLEKWVSTNCSLIRPNPATYLKRFGEMLATVRSLHPGVPMVVPVRLSHQPAFGPDPYSYLDGWADLQREAQIHYAVWQRELPDLHVIEMDRIFGGIWKTEPRIESHCPFFKISLEENDGKITGLHASRDVEHIGSMWPRLADSLERFMKTGSVYYDKNQSIPANWQRPWNPMGMDREAMLAKLSSGGNYHCAEAVGAFYLDLQTDYTELLATTGHLTPVCHNTLHMIKNYGRIYRNPIMAEWCDAHKKTAGQFTANGPIYQADYLRRIDEIKAFALG